MSDQNDDSNQGGRIGEIASLVTAVTGLIFLLNQIFGNSPPASNPQCTPREVTEEIKFARNSFDQIITGCISANNPDTYYLDARTNQELLIEITSGDIEVVVTDSSGRFLGEIYSANPAFRGRLPSNGKIKVVARTKVEEAIRYGLFVKIE